MINPHSPPPGLSTEVIAITAQSRRVDSSAFRINNRGYFEKLSCIVWIDAGYTYVVRAGQGSAREFRPIATSSEYIYISQDKVGFRLDEHQANFSGAYPNYLRG